MSEREEVRASELFERMTTLEVRVTRLEAMLPHDPPEPGSLDEALKYCTTRLRAENTIAASRAENQDDGPYQDDKENDRWRKRNKKLLEQAKGRCSRWTLLLALIHAEAKREDASMSLEFPL